ncbi:DUF6851 domain-containing protein (plasmid) [Tundrisphaera lichenicola]|uniref:vanadium-dependent haloperoxidase n=1 Tax=Tundrisphaera lichenicola TaxID=2029860 RepID=UPI003EBA005C
MKGIRPDFVAPLLTLAVFINAPGVGRADTVVVRWSDTTLECVRQSKIGPPMVARVLGIVHTCMYDAWAAYDPVAVGTRFGGDLRRPRFERTRANKAKAISFAAYYALVDLFPNLRGIAEAQFAKLGYDPTDDSIPAQIGTACALAVTEFRHGDGSNQLGDLHPGPYSDYTGYQPVNMPERINDPNHWQPIGFADGQGGTVVPAYIGPHWGLVTPFALESGDQFRPPPPALFGSREYAHQARQVLRYSAALTDTQKVIAEYWADGPNSELPPGHWLLFAQFVSRRDEHDLDRDARMFFLVANAVMDAGIAAWDTKRAYDYVRPVTAVHFLFAGGPVRAWAGPYLGTRWIDGGDWLPYQPLTFITPPFPEYVSGHSAFSAASAEVLRRFTGSDHFQGKVVIPRGSSRVEPGLTPARDTILRWPTFSAAADEAGRSRRYGGIHFEPGDLEGRTLGRRVGAAVWEKALTYFDGTAAD